jgi:6-phosphogluconolactonase
MIRTYDDLDRLSNATAEFICEAAKRNITAKGKFTLVLSGGETPKETYFLLASRTFRDRIDWNKVFIFFGDERYVPHDNVNSNYHMADETLLVDIPIPDENVFAVPTDSTPGNDALIYEAQLKKIFPAQFPLFDLNLLGLGENGHTASLFPNTDILNEKTRWVKDVFVKEVNMERISLTIPAINSSKQIIFLVSGESKADVVNDVLNGIKNPEQLPAQFIQPVNGELFWFLDKAAAEKLPKSEI